MLEKYSKRRGPAVAGHSYMTPSLHNQTFSDSAEESVMHAFDDARFQFRTINGIADEVGLTEDCVKKIIDKLLRGGKLRVSPVQDAGNRDLYTLASRPRTAQEIFSEARAFLAGAAK